MNTKRIRRIALCVAIAFAVVAFAAVFVPVPPHGRFTMTGIGNNGDAYFKASEGKFTSVVWDGERNQDGVEHRRFIGDYRKEHGHGILVTPDGSAAELRATLLSLRILDPRTPPAGPFYRYEIYKGR